MNNELANVKMNTHTNWLTDWVSKTNLLQVKERERERAKEMSQRINSIKVCSADVVIGNNESDEMRWSVSKAKTKK